MKKILFFLLHIFILIKCYSPLDFNDFDKIDLEERVNNFIGYSELTNFSVKIEWELKPFVDFIEYKIFRSTTLPVSENSELVFQSEISSLTNFYDYILQHSTSYYYKLYTYYDNDISVCSASIEIVTKELPSTDYILFSDSPSSSSKISKLSIDGSQKIPLFSGHSPAWHPKGHYIAYADYSSDSNSDFTIYLADANGTSTFPIANIDTTLNSSVYVNDICWSRDGRYLFINFLLADYVYKIDLTNKDISFFGEGDNISCSPITDEILISSQGQDVKIYNYNGQILRTYSFSQTAYSNGNYHPLGEKFIHRKGSTYIFNFSLGTDTEIHKGLLNDYFWSPDASTLYFLMGKLYKLDGNVNSDVTGSQVLVAEGIYQPDWSIIND